MVSTHQKVLSVQCTREPSQLFSAIVILFIYLCCLLPVPLSSAIRVTSCRNDFQLCETCRELRERLATEGMRSSWSVFSLLMILNCSGKAPEWLSGTMLRNGPGMFKIGETEYKHWFDGLAYIQRYHFQDGKVWVFISLEKRPLEY